MKTFTQVRELTGRKPAGQLVMNKKFGRIQVMIYKDRNDLLLILMEIDWILIELRKKLKKQLLNLLSSTRDNYGRFL